MPARQSSVSGTNIRVGTGSVDVAATHHGSSYATTVTASLSCTLHVGATVPAGATIHQVTLNGSPAHYTIRDTNAGREVLVSTPCRGQTWRVTWSPAEQSPSPFGINIFDGAGQPGSFGGEDGQVAGQRLARAGGDQLAVPGGDGAGERVHQARVAAAVALRGIHRARRAG